MSVVTVILIALGAGIAGLVGGYFLRLVIAMGKKGSMEVRLKKMELQAKEDAKKVIDVAEQKALKVKEDLREKEREHDALHKKKEEHLLKKEELLDRRQIDIDKEVEHLKEKIEEVKTIKERTLAIEEEKTKALGKVAELSPQEAKAELLERIEKAYEEDILIRIQKLEHVGKEKIDRRAQEILTTSIHRLANAVDSEVLATNVAIPNDEIKGKIIGKEGRNIRAFERAAGVELIVDDTPGVVTISAFDPVRRQIARIALENLIIDGRIQPSRIEDLVEKAKQEISKIVKEKGSQAAYECGVLNLDPRLILILGRLYFRTSYGQNVLQHSIEMAHIAGMIAEEVGADVAVCKAGALLHDIGKTVSQEVQGTHVEIGRRILKKFGASEAIIQAMQSHHEEYPYETVESVIVQAADAISGGRPGARRDTVENYLKRLQELEGIATAFEGVDKAYAIAAGREVRVFVTPERVSDLEAKRIAREIAVKVEGEMNYPGEIKVAVIRESRVVEYAR